MVRLCFALLLLRKEQDGIHMPRGLMDDLEGKVIGEKFHKCGLGKDILSADLNGEDATSRIHTQKRQKYLFCSHRHKSPQKRNVFEDFLCCFDRQE